MVRWLRWALMMALGLSPQAADAQTQASAPIPSTLVFAVRGPFSTPPQSLRLPHQPGESAAWTAAATAPWLTVSPSTGVAAGRLIVALRPEALPAEGEHSAAITITFVGGAPPVVVPVSLSRRNAGGIPPMGALDYPPATPTRTSGPQAFHGWAIDDLWLDRVILVAGPERRPVAIARFAEGGRPDIEALQPPVPRQTRSAWSAVVAPADHPWLRGLVSVTAVAIDLEGQTTDLGSREVTFEAAPPPPSWAPTLWWTAAGLLVIAIVLLVTMRTTAPALVQSAPIRPWEIIAVFTVLVAFGFVRPDSLSRSLEYDELYSASHFIVDVPVTTAAAGVGVFNNHPGYSMAAWVTTRLLGREEWLIRLPALCFGALGILALWLSARTWVSPWVAVAAATMLAVSPEWGVWSRSARGYTGSAAAVICAVWLWHHTRTSGRRSTTIGLGLMLAIAVWMHLYAAAVLGAMAVALVTDALGWSSPSTRGNGRAVAAALLIGAAGALALYAPMATDLIAVAQGRGRGAFTAAFLTDLASSLIGGSAWWTSGAAVFLAAWGTYTLWRIDRGLVVLTTAAIALPLVFVAGVITPRDLYPRFFVYWLPMLCLILAAGVFARWSHRVVRIGAVGVGVVLVTAWLGPARTSLAGTWSYRTAIPTPDPSVPTLVFGADGTMMRYYAGPLTPVTAMEEVDAAWDGRPEVRVLYHDVPWNAPELVAFAARLGTQCGAAARGTVVTFTCR